MASLYRQLLGESYERLPPALQRFHNRAKAEARGTVKVTRGGWLASLMADVMGLPAAGESVAAHLTVEAGPHGETWSRQFGTRDRLVTRQWARDGLLVESTGMARLAIRLEAESDRLVFTFVRAYLGPLPLPGCLAVRVESAAVVKSSPDSWRIYVRISAPVVGFLASYEGEVVPDETSRVR